MNQEKFLAGLMEELRRRAAAKREAGAPNRNAWDEVNESLLFADPFSNPHAGYGRVADMGL